MVVRPSVLIPASEVGKGLERSARGWRGLERCWRGLERSGEAGIFFVLAVIHLKTQLKHY